MKLFSWKNCLSVFIFLFGILICQYTGNRGLFPIDSFSHFDSGYRILKGDLPFKDYWIVSGFFVDYLQSIIFYTFGVNWQTYLLNASILNGTVALLLYFLFNNLGLNFKLSFFYAICFSILAYPSSGTPFVDHHSTFLSIIAIIMLIKSLKTNQLSLWFLVPVFLFLAFLSKQVPATYMLFATLFLTFLHLLHQEKKELIKILSTLFASSIISILLFLIFLQINEIDFKSFITQYFYHPSIIGEERYISIKYDFKNTFLNFKFIYLSLFFLIFFTFKSLKNEKIKNYYKHLNFKILLICVLIFITLAHHIIFTKNQIFIFFLIPLTLGFANIQLNKIEINHKKYLNIVLITLCIGMTFKYHFRYNIDRKFHELNNVKFSQTFEAKNFNAKFFGLKWITKKNNNTEKIDAEIKFLKNFKKILDLDKNKKIVLTNYSFFSVLSEENVSGFSRWYPEDNSGFPMKVPWNKDPKYVQNYKDLITSIFRKRKIKSVYILPDIKEKNLLEYVDSKCFNKIELEDSIIKYEVNNNCKKLLK